MTEEKLMLGTVGIEAPRANRFEKLDMTAATRRRGGKESRSVALSRSSPKGHFGFTSTSSLEARLKSHVI